MAQLILIKVDQDDISYRLACAIANEYDPGTQTVLLQEPIRLNPDDAEVIMVPRAICYEFNADILQDVNGLVSAGLEKISVAHRIMRIALTPAVFEQSDQPPVFH